ncbi:non-specific lipid-transfer protein 2 [Cucumis melo var. makuwa]|uniref:Non-specific lipid-transfer protein 2 n=1 Tax=Cucumis melo var. makuwa TaxID=1194695 RepID=A0A5D3BQ95_CUCMM|nr:non-specific lipid-transfer protein 2 [Cucumis melo var. makuwa]
MKASRIGIILMIVGVILSISNSNEVKWWKQQIKCKIKEQKPCLCGYLSNPFLKNFVNSPKCKKRYPRSGLLFQFLEQDPPFQHIPLVDNARYLNLAYQFPGLKTLRSCGIFPASWAFVEWWWLPFIHFVNSMYPLTSAEPTVIDITYRQYGIMSKGHR